MIVKKIKVTSFSTQEEILVLENAAICTANEEKQKTGENQFWIMDERGSDVLHIFHDYRLQQIAKDLMIFFAYTDYKNEKVSLYVWS